LYNDSGNPVIQNNIFSANSARSGGGLFNATGTPIVQNNIFISNTSEYAGGGIFNHYGSPVIRSNIVVGNTAGSIGGGIYNSGAPTLDYNDVWNNTGGNYSGVYPGAQDISIDPRLVDPANGDFHLAADSPCIDAADPVNYPPTDFEGDPRPNGVAPDIGADEFYARMD
jgi:hypothetical protein